MRRLYLLFILLFLLSFCSCKIVHNDCGTTFIIQGVVVNANNKIPINGAKVFFIDTGYHNSEIASQRRFSIEIGITDLQGRIDIKFDYRFSYNEGWGYEEPKKTFEIHISKESFKEKILLLKESDFKKEKNIVYVDLSEIYLEEE